jgi:hypothetical protein
MNLVKLTGDDGVGVWVSSPLLYGSGWMINMTEEGGQPEFSVAVRRGTTRLARKARAVLRAAGIDAKILNEYGTRTSYLPPDYKARLCAAFDLKIKEGSVIPMVGYVGGVMAGLSDQRVAEMVGRGDAVAWGLSVEMVARAACIKAEVDAG